jgi:WD40 repeat protein
MFTIDAHPEGLHTFCMTFVPGQALLASAGKDGVRVWDLIRREEAYHLDTSGSDVSSLSCSPDGRYLVVCQDTVPKMIRVWDWNADRIEKVLDVDENSVVQCSIYSPDGQTLAIGGYRRRNWTMDYSIRRLNTKTWKPRRLLDGHEHQTGFLAYSPDRTLLAPAADARVAVSLVSGQPTRPTSAPLAAMKQPPRHGRLERLALMPLSDRYVDRHDEAVAVSDDVDLAAPAAARPP